MKSELFYRNLFADSLDGILLTDEKGVISFASPAIRKILGHSAEETAGKNIFDFVHPDDLQVAESNFRDEVKMEPRLKFVNVRLVKVDAEYVWCIVRSHNLLFNPYVGKMVVYFYDDTLRREAEMALKESEAEQRKLLEELIEQEIQKQKLLTQATIDGQEKERLELGKELHDNFSQHLTMTKLYLEVVREKAPDEILEMVSHAHSNLSDIINDIRKLSQSLVPPTLGDLGLIESIQDLCDSLRRTQTIKVEFYHRHFDETVMADNMKLMLFRIIQEQVNNVIRHSQAGKLTIKLQADAEQVFLSIADNGIGFDATIKKRGLGLTSIFNRVGLFNGQMHLRTSMGKGCLLSITVPLE
jgi:PAS domain S-box-containing protein